MIISTCLNNETKKNLWNTVKKTNFKQEKNWNNYTFPQTKDTAITKSQTKNDCYQRARVKRSDEPELTKSLSGGRPGWITFYAVLEYRLLWSFSLAKKERLTLSYGSGASWKPGSWINSRNLQKTALGLFSWQSTYKR